MIMPPLKQDRFAAYNAAQKKNPPITTQYPKMLTNEDGSTCIVQDEAEHQALVGDTKFEAKPYWGPSANAAPDKAQPPAAPVKAPEVLVTDDMRRRRGSGAKNLGNTGASVSEMVPAQTVFTDVPPPSAA
jgi:hypothetical protein